MLRRQLGDGGIDVGRPLEVERAKAVARAAGGILGIGGVWGTEKGVLQELESAFDAKV